LNQVVCYSLSRKETSAAYFGSFPALWAFEVHAEGVIVSLARPITHQTPCHNRPLSNGLKAKRSAFVLNRLLMPREKSENQSFALCAASCHKIQRTAQHLK
jgi:hypothetical protein